MVAWHSVIKFTPPGKSQGCVADLLDKKKAIDAQSSHFAEKYESTVAVIRRVGAQAGGVLEAFGVPAKHFEEVDESNIMEYLSVLEQVRTTVWLHVSTVAVSRSYVSAVVCRPSCPTSNSTSPRPCLRRRSAHLHRSRRQNHPVTSSAELARALAPH